MDEKIFEMKLVDTKEVEASAPQTEEEDDTMDYFQKLANS